MSEVLSLAAERRAITGKGQARAARRAGKVPGVVYGGDIPPDHIALDYNEVLKAYHKGHFGSNLVMLDVEGETTQAIPRDVQVHPVNERPLHLDFLRVSEGTRIAVDVTVHFLNEGASPGLKRGGVLNIVRHDVELMCPAVSIPEYLEADLTGLDIGDAVKISMIKLPENVVPTITDRDFTIATIAAPSGMRSAEAEEEEVEGAEVPEEKEEEAAAEE